MISDNTVGTERPHILVLGDLMLDRYTYGVAARISPEAPVLVVKTISREIRLGGAANVAANCRALDARVTLIGLVGDDHEAATMRRLIQECGAEHHLSVDGTRCTTVKERILGQSPHRTPQQILRIDTETIASGEESEGRLLAAIEETLDKVQLVLLSDYRKGVCTPRVLEAVISVANQRQLPVLIDPGMNADWNRYRGASLIKPNRREAASASGLEIHSESDAAIAASLLSERFKIPAVVVTLDQDGMLLHQHGHAASVYRGTLRAVSDVTGAGDTVFAVLGVALAQGIALEMAVQHAIIAAELQVGKQGATTVTWKEIAISRNLKSPKPKIVTREWLASHCDSLRNCGKRIAFTNGCFDLLHAGHVHCLREARACGDLLIVALNDDASVRRLKGANRPVNCAVDRAKVLAGLECVDFVVEFDEDTPHNLLQVIRPDVLVKGGDYSDDQVIGREVVKSYGGRIVVTGLISGVSTTSILARYAQAGPS